MITMFVYLYNICIYIYMYIWKCTCSKLSKKNIYTVYRSRIHNSYIFRCMCIDILQYNVHATPLYCQWPFFCFSKQIFQTPSGLLIHLLILHSLSPQRSQNCVLQPVEVSRFSRVSSPVFLTVNMGKHICNMYYLKLSICSLKN